MPTPLINQACETKNAIFFCEVPLSTKDSREGKNNATENYSKILASKTESGSWQYNSLLQTPSSLNNSNISQICKDCQASFVHDHCKRKTTCKKNLREEKKSNIFQYPFVSYCCSFTLSCPNAWVRENKRIALFRKTRKKNIISSSDTFWAFRYFDHLLTNPHQG